MEHLALRMELRIQLGASEWKGKYKEVQFLPATTTFSRTESESTMM